MNTRHLRITAILLVLVMLLPMAACSGMLGKTLMTLEKDGIKVSLSVNMYELMLSRGKGSLIEQKNSVNGMYANQEGFWNYQSKFDGVNMTTLGYAQRIITQYGLTGNVSYGERKSRDYVYLRFTMPLSDGVNEYLCGVYKTNQAFWLIQMNGKTENFDEIKWYEYLDSVTFSN